MLGISGPTSSTPRESRPRLRLGPSGLRALPYFKRAGLLRSSDENAAERVTHGQATRDSDHHLSANLQGRYSIEDIRPSEFMYSRNYAYCARSTPPRSVSSGWPGPDPHC